MGMITTLPGEALDEASPRYPRSAPQRPSQAILAALQAQKSLRSDW